MINDAAAAGVAEMHLGAGRGFMGKTLCSRSARGSARVLLIKVSSCRSSLGIFRGRAGSRPKNTSRVRPRGQGPFLGGMGRATHEYVKELERLLWPELIVIGGGISSKHEKFFKFMHPRAKLVPAEFLNQAGIAGAAMWAVEAK